MNKKETIRKELVEIGVQIAALEIANRFEAVEILGKRYDELYIVYKEMI